MTNYPKWDATSYIKAFAQKSLGDFNWHHVTIYSRATFSAVLKVKTSGKYSPSYITNADQSLSNFPGLYKLLGLFFVNTAFEMGFVEDVLDDNELTHNPVMSVVFNEAYMNLINEVSTNTKNEHIDNIKRLISINKDTSIIYCWHFLELAVRHNLLDRMIEEMYLLKEIDAFKNRKGE